MNALARRLIVCTGPGLLVAGLGICLWLLFGLSQRSLLDWWILGTVLAPARVLPLVGLAIALALCRRGGLVAGFLAFVAGLAGGLWAERFLVGVLISGPEPTELLAPALSLMAGAALLSPSRLRAYIVPLAAVFAGLAAGLLVRLSDPSLRDPVFPIAGTLVALWIVLAVMLTVRAFRRQWFDIAARIVGSWLIAIALLHGGAVIAQAMRVPLQQAPLARPADPALPGQTGEEGLFPDPDAFPGDEPSDAPPGMEPFRQP